MLNPGKDRLPRERCVAHHDDRVSPRRRRKRHTRCERWEALQVDTEDTQDPNETHDGILADQVLRVLSVNGLFLGMPFHSRMLAKLGRLKI